MHRKKGFCVLSSLLLLTATTLTAQAQLLWTVGLDDDGWPVGDGGGPNASFVQETGDISPLPGVADSPEVNQQADNDYYLAGTYTNVISSVTDAYGAYDPIGVVAANEEAAERAFAGGDLDLRYHFNLPATLQPTNLLTVTFDALNLDTPGAVNTDPRFGIEVYFNGVLVQPEILIRAAQLGTDYSTPVFTLASVNAGVGPGFDNIVSLRGISYNDEGGGNWMGIDYVRLNMPAPPTGQVTIVRQPANVSVEERTRATFSVEVSHTGGTPPSYQWRSNGVDIVGATAASYQTPVLATNNTGARYSVRVSVPGDEEISTEAILTVLPDSTPPTVVGAAAFPGTTKIGVTFNEDLEVASAGSAANYKVNGVAVTSVLVRTNVANELTNEKNLVQLTVATALTSDFTVTVSGVKDVKGNTMTSMDFAGKILKLTSTDIGSPEGEPGGPDPQAPSTVTTWGPGAFDVLTIGSNDYWNNADGFHFLWEPKTNSFDVKVRVVSVSPINNWSAGAIEVREGPPTPNGAGWELARHYFAKVDYGGPDPVTVLDNSGDGADSYEFNCRRAPGDPTLRETSNNAPGGSVGWGGTGPGNPSPVPFPNAWIRIARVKNGTNDHLLGYSSSDGENWSLRQDVDLNDETHAGFLNLNGEPAGPWPDVCYVGLGSTSHTGIGNNNPINEGTVGEFWYSPVGQPYGCFVIYRDYGDVVTLTRPTLSFTVNANGTVTLAYTGKLYSSATVNGPYAPVSGATNPHVVNPRAAGAPATTFYQAGP